MNRTTCPGHLDDMSENLRTDNNPPLGVVCPVVRTDRGKRLNELQRELRRESTRAWHEQRTAAGRCHRCPRLTEEAGWYCRRCRIEISELRAQRRASRNAVTDGDLASHGLQHQEAGRAWADVKA